MPISRVERQRPILGALFFWVLVLSLTGMKAAAAQTGEGSAWCSAAPWVTFAPSKSTMSIDAGSSVGRLGSGGRLAPSWVPAASSLLLTRASTGTREASPVLALFQETRVHSTKWLEGGLIGAIIGGVSVGVLASKMCNADSGTNCSITVPTVTLAGAALGWVVGALIGGQIPKAEPTAGPSPQSP